eukprot:s8868_g1.t2
MKSHGRLFLRSHFGLVLSCPSPSPIEAGPGEVCAPPGGSEVSQLLKVLLCGRDGQLWSKPVVGGQWCPCPYGVHVNMSRIKAFELLGGDRYVFFFQDGHGGICAGPDAVLMYDLQRNKWSPPTSARATRGGHQEEVHWQPLCAAQSGEPLKDDARVEKLCAWILEASMDYVVLLAPVTRDGFQRGCHQEGHTALYFISHTGQELVHHLPCDLWRMTVQRYNDYVLFVKDFGDEALDFPDYPSDHPFTAGWLLAADDWTASPMAVTLPTDHPDWGGSAWSLVIARGALEETPDRRLDMAPRIYLIEEDAGLRIWVTRRIGELHSGWQPPTWCSDDSGYDLTARVRSREIWLCAGGATTTPAPLSIADAWMDGRMDAWTDGRKDGWMDGRKDGWTEAWMDEMRCDAMR